MYAYIWGRNWGRQSKYEYEEIRVPRYFILWTKDLIGLLSGRWLRIAKKERCGN